MLLNRAKWSRKILLPLSTTRRKTKLQSKIPASVLVEQKTGILFVFCTPLLERKIQKPPANAKKLSRNCFTWNIFTPNYGHLLKPAHYQEPMSGSYRPPIHGMIMIKRHVTIGQGVGDSPTPYRMKYDTKSTIQRIVIQSHEGTGEV